ncbi:MAG: Ferredoxin-type protein NapF [Desulfovibrio sp.]
MGKTTTKKPAQADLVWLRRVVQALCLALFCLLLGAAEQGSFLGLPADLFLRHDPLVGAAVPLAARSFIVTLLPAGVVVLTALVAGRIFCGWICPMGTTLDAGGKLARMGGRKNKKRAPSPVLRRYKYLLFAVVMAAALLGANIAFWASPIPLVTRLYALVLHPLGLVGMDATLAVAEPFTQRLGYTQLQYLFPALRSYHTTWFVVLFWVGLFLLERARPRFWCRYLCPAGALLGLASRFAFWKRRAANSCNSCGGCAAKCPTGILRENPAKADTSECIACMSCITACNKGAVSFGRGKGERAATACFYPSRRAFCGAVAVGATLAGATRFEIGASTSNLVRPPGSLPEVDFLARCVRCGQCMKACPTGGLQPAMLQAGFSGMFSPFLAPRSGPCLPECAACGTICPSRAIHALPVKEKRWAKIGTAVIDKNRCVAWKEDRRCMVCEETCPYAAIKLISADGHIAPVPEVRAERCYGCGYCEKHCPTATPAIAIEAAGALRQRSPGFKKTAMAAGLKLDPAEHGTDHQGHEFFGGGAPPGFLD